MGLDNTNRKNVGAMKGNGSKAKLMDREELLILKAISMKDYTAMI